MTPLELLLILCPQVRERPGEVTRSLLDPAVEGVDFDPLAVTDFVGVVDKGSFGVAVIQPDKLVTGGPAGGFFENALYVNGAIEADLFT